MTEAGSIIGTAQYLSPEQARGAPVDQTSDLYSTGIVLYELLTGTVPFTGETPVEIAMKHLSQVPAPPSTHRPEIPRDLDYVALRALAKDPADRYHSAEEMDSDLERIARGIGVSAETAEAATTVLSRTDVGEAATTIRPAAGAGSPTYTPGRYYEYDEPPRRRSIWPWLLGTLLVALALVGGWFAYQELESQLDAAKPVAVPDVDGSVERLAVQQIRDAGLKELVERRPNDDGVKPGIVFEQDPQAGDRIERGNFVTIGLDRPVEGTRPHARRQQPRPGRRRADRRRPRAERRPGQLARAGQHRARDRTQGGHRGDRRHDRSRQRLLRAEADRSPERRRQPVRERPVRPPGRRLRRLAPERRGRRRRGHRRRPEPRRRDPAGQGLGDHAAGLRGAQDLADPGREQPDRGGRDRAAAAIGVRGRWSRRSRGRKPRRSRALTGPEGGSEAEQGTTVVIVVGRFEPPADG